MYLIDDQDFRWEYLPIILEELNNKSNDHFVDGFNGNRKAYRDYDTIKEAIEDQNGIWILDVGLDDYSEETALQLKETYNIPQQEFIEKSKIIGNDKYITFYVLLEILTQYNRPLIGISSGSVPVLRFFKSNWPFKNFEIALGQCTENWVPDFANELLTKLNHPINRLLELLAQRTTNGNHNWGPGLTFPPVQVDALADFLRFNRRELLDMIGITQNDYENTIGECLKSFGTSDSRNIPLFAVVLIALGVLRNEYADYFDQKTESMFFEEIRRVEAALKKDGKVNVAKYFVRNSSIIPPQDEHYFRESCKNLYQLFKYLFFYKDHFLFDEVEIDLNDSGVSFFIKSYDGKSLIVNQNTLFERLIDYTTGAAMHQAQPGDLKIHFHDSYSIIARVNLLMNYSNDHGLDQFFGSKGAFAIQKENNLYRVQFKA